MSGRGHKRARSYFSEFTDSGAQSPQENQPQQEPQKPAVEEQSERAVPPVRGHRRYFSVTLPLAVLFSVKPVVGKPAQEQSSKMARPRSPQKKQEFSYSQMETMLDQALVGIRQKLGELSSERNKMEYQMDALSSGIQAACVQCNRRVSQSSSRSASIRRTRSLGEAPLHRVHKHLSAPRTETDGPIDDRSSTHSSSRESLRNSPNVEHRPSLGDSAFSLTSSFSSSLGSSMSKPFSDSRAWSSSGGNEVFVSDWLSDTVIPELPESPKHISFSSTPSNTPHICVHSPPANKVTFRQQSTPEVVHRGFSVSPKIASDCGSLPEKLTFFGTDSLSQASLSQASICSNESPLRSGSTQILRRSSLTGQLEHIDRIRPRVKRIASFSVSVSPEKTLPGSLSCSYNSLKDSRGADNRKLLRSNKTKSFSSSRINYRSVILPGIETTV